MATSPRIHGVSPFYKWDNKLTLGVNKALSACYGTLKMRPCRVGKKKGWQDLKTERKWRVREDPRDRQAALPGYHFKMGCWPDVKTPRQPCGVKMCPRIGDLKQTLAEEQDKNNIPTWGWF